MLKDRKLACETESLHLAIGSCFFMFKQGKSIIIMIVVWLIGDCLFLACETFSSKSSVYQCNLLHFPSTSDGNGPKN